MERPGKVGLGGGVLGLANGEFGGVGLMIGFGKVSFGMVFFLTREMLMFLFCPNCIVFVAISSTLLYLGWVRLK